MLHSFVVRYVSHLGCPRAVPNGGDPNLRQIVATGKFEPGKEIPDGMLVVLEPRVLLGLVHFWLFPLVGSPFPGCP